MQAQFSTPRLMLRLISEEDTVFIRALVNSEGWLQFIGNRNVYSDEDALRYIQKIKNTPELFYWVVNLKGGNEPIGIISFLKRSYLDHFDIGFAFLPEFGGQGYALEATREVLAEAEKQHETLLASTIPPNKRSIHLLKKLGFRFEKEIEVEKETLHVYIYK
ncbi:MAG: GNAT family N-acetyltransferase [Ferruginibacter sp.]